MNKKILIGSIIAVSTLLLMPSIPAIQHITIEEDIKQNIQEKLDSINLDTIKNYEISDVKHPFLYLFVLSLVELYVNRILFYEALMNSIPIDFIFHSFIILFLFSILFARYIWLYSVVVVWVDFWQKIADKNGWDWFIRWWYNTSKNHMTYRL